MRTPSISSAGSTSAKGRWCWRRRPRRSGTIDDAWWRWVIDFGAPGPDRGEGGKYLILPPGYDGPVPEGGFYVARSRTARVLILGRMFMEKDDPEAGRRPDPQVHEDLPVRSRRRGHQHRRVPRRQDASSAASSPPPPTGVPRRQRQGDEHDSAQRLQLLRDAERRRAARTRPPRSIPS